MLTLFACMKSNDFSEKECPSEMAAFRRCYYESQVSAFLSVFSHDVIYCFFFH